ncbi:MAG: hypothetical protein E6J90_01790 [Deltaproteobacteria bacterium]|nr:MAG: hypothetical protein E6J90_01790 [Deltaproteobacteria bacterium]
MYTALVNTQKSELIMTSIDPTDDHAELSLGSFRQARWALSVSQLASRKMQGTMHDRCRDGLPYATSDARTTPRHERFDA